MLDELIARASTPGKENWVLAARGLDLSAQLADHTNPKAALALTDRALAALAHTQELGERALVLRHVGQLHRDLKQPALAIAPLEEAVKDYDASSDAYDVGTTRAHLAFALWDSGRDKPRAIEMAKLAAADLARAETGENIAQWRANVAAFVKAHAAP